jgi:cytochrome bd-type quinol oxidase subunit 2
MQRFAKLALIAGTAAAAFMPVVAHGQATSFSVESVGSQIGLGDADLRQTVINILQLVLGLLSLIAVVMIIIGGFTWLTAGGNEDKVDKAKKIISAAVIGLIIVLLAWAIVIFVARTTANVTST